MIKQIHFYTLTMNVNSGNCGKIENNVINIPNKLSGKFECIQFNYIRLWHFITAVCVKWPFHLIVFVPKQWTMFNKQCFESITKLHLIENIHFGKNLIDSPKASNVIIIRSKFIDLDSGSLYISSNFFFFSFWFGGNLFLSTSSKKKTKTKTNSKELKSKHSIII